jgi:hypothetical protein
VGSGLILLAIVGAWLAVLVPMALRRYDTSHIVTVDKFHDAMRVLSRRGGPDPDPDPGTPAPLPGRFRTASGAVSARLAARRSRPPLSAAARRRRVLLTLVAASVGTAVGFVLGPLWLLAPHLLADLLLVAFLVHLRRTAAARAEREWRTAMQPDVRRRVRTATRPVVEPVAQRCAPALRGPVHVAGIPNRMPARPAPLVAPAAVSPPAARGAQGEAWSPVPVPAPTYLSAPVAPRRVVDVTRPGSYAEGDGLPDAEREIGIVDEGPALDEILERRRAVNDW